MGLEAKCRVRVSDASGKREAEGTVLLETDELIVRGEARVRVPRATIQSAIVREGILTITAPPHVVSLTLGDAAAKWKQKLEEPPKPLIDKLDVKQNAKVWLLAVKDDVLEKQLAGRTDNVLAGRTASNCDVVFVAVENEKDLDRIDRALDALSDAGAIWVIHRKGPTGVADTTIFARAKQLGLAYTKVARVSDTHTAEKLVRPLARRSTSKSSRSK